MRDSSVQSPDSPFRFPFNERAAREAQQVKRLKSQLENLDAKRLETLHSNSKLTSTEALRILQSFNIEEKSRLQPLKEIEALVAVELQYREKMRERQGLEKEMRMTERNVDNAVNRARLAQQRLEEAQREVMESKLNMEDCLKAQKDLTAREKEAANELEKLNMSLDKNTEKVRITLKKREYESLQRESDYLQKESARLEDVASSLREEAEKIKFRSDVIRREQGERKGN